MCSDLYRHSIRTDRYTDMENRYGSGKAISVRVDAIRDDPGLAATTGHSIGLNRVDSTMTSPMLRSYGS